MQTVGQQSSGSDVRTLHDVCEFSSLCLHMPLEGIKSLFEIEVTVVAARRQDEDDADLVSSGQRVRIGRAADNLTSKMGNGN
jgi:hypothetical protein